MKAWLLGFVLLMGLVMVSPAAASLGQFIANGTLTGVNVEVIITVPTSASSYDAGSSATLDVSGTSRSDSPVVVCVWVNNLGGSGTAVGTTAWSVTALPLTVGSNVITVTCTNAGGTAGNDVITVTRSGGSSSMPISAGRLPAGNTSVPQSVWSTTGVPGGIPSATWTQSSSVAAYSGTAATINNAIANCGTNQYVQLGAGTFNLTTPILFSKDNCELRGMGADQTFLFISQGTGPGGRCGLGGFTGGVISFCHDVCSLGLTLNGGCGPQHTATINASPGYEQGRTSLVFSSIAGLTVGGTVFIDMLDTNTDGYPAAGDTFWCQTGPPCTAEGDDPYQRTGRTYVEPHIVVSCGTAVADAACTSTTVVIDPPIIDSTFRASQQPGAWWADSTTVLRNAGLRDFSFDYTAANQGPGVLMVNATNDWMTGVRSIFNTGPGQFVMQLEIINGFRVSVKSNMFYGPTSQGNTQYTYAPHVTGSMLFENNILHRNVCPVCVNDTEVASVYAYNYVDGGFYSTYGEQDHSMTGYNLHEGENHGQYYLDSNHGPHFFQTYFRNQIDRNAHAVAAVSTVAGFAMLHHSRFPNFLGNVIYNGYTVYQAINCSGGSSSNCGDFTVYVFGWTGNCGACDPLVLDSNVNRTALRWGNWDNVTAGANQNVTGDQSGTRWCGSAANTNWAKCTSTIQTEVPSTIPNYPNAIPGTPGSEMSTLPPSLYLSTKPAFFGTDAWPPIGPDVTASPVIANSGGHANKIPARKCFEAAANDPLAAYTSSNPRIRVFSRTACYGTAL